MSDTHAGHEAKHPYHLVDPSPWPIVGSISALLLTGGTVMYMHDLGLQRQDRAGVGRARRARHHVLLVARRGEGGHLPGPSLAGGADRPALRHGALHRLRGDVLRGLLLGLFRRQPVPDRAIGSPGRRWACRPSTRSSCRCSTRSSCCSPASPSPGRTMRCARATARASCRASALTILLGALFTCVQAYEYSHAAFGFRERHLPLDLLHGDRLPRLPRHHRHHSS